MGHSGSPLAEEGTAVTAVDLVSALDLPRVCLPIKADLGRLPWELLNGGHSLQLQLETQLLSKLPLNALGQPGKDGDGRALRQDTSGSQLTALAYESSQHNSGLQPKPAVMFIWPLERLRGYHCWPATIEMSLGGQALLPCRMSPWFGHC